MRQIFEYLQPLSDDRVVFFAFDVGDEAQSTGVVLVGGIIQTLTCGRQPWDTECFLVHEVLVTQACLRTAPAIRGKTTPPRKARVPLILARLLHRGNQLDPDGEAACSSRQNSLRWL